MIEEYHESGDPIWYKGVAGVYRGPAPIENSKAMASIEIGGELRIVPMDDLKKRL